MLRADWKGIARAAGFRVAHDDSITLGLEGGSSQRLAFELDEGGESLYAVSVIAGPRTLEAAASDETIWRYAWNRNRLSDLLGFTIDRHGRLVGEAWIPMDHLTPEEFTLYITELARVSDWHEFRLTGNNIY
jgi:hypothetical protein